MLLKVVADSGDIGRDFDAIRQSDARHLAESRIGLLGRHRSYDRADAPALGLPLSAGDFDFTLGVLRPFRTS